MRINALMFGLSLLLATGAQAQEMKPVHDHGQARFHAFRLDTAVGDKTSKWDLKAWVGNDRNKLWLKSEGDHFDGQTNTESWALYSRNVAPFWDVQAGVRVDGGYSDHSYLTVGLTGLAPYFFDTEAHLFVREDGHLRARIRQENDLLVTNRLILRPYGELNMAAERDRFEGLGAGLTSLELGLQTRYEVNRQFVPYLDLRFEQKLGETADLARISGTNPRETKLLVGIGWLF